ncbi:unnamed protein product [Phytophthora lilii]|uniref:Unnamed protein product n=1 Tax=Phytophthora lilii TaxID=2077276 RepID=A0A9W6TFV4_9STRA|nr:unnamed protein product [Phytophthora lilii]
MPPPVGRPAASAAKGFLLARSQRFAGRQSLQKPTIRSFSSSTDNDEFPQFERGYDLAAGLWHRCYQRLPKLQEYQEKEVFVDSLNSLAQVWLFIQLQLPQKTSVDLLEFVEGARLATEANLRTMNCVEFPEFLAEKENGSSEVADSLQQFTTPAYYHQMALQVKKNYLQRNFYVECEGMRIEKAQLAQVVYRRLTEKEYADLVSLKKPPTGVSPEATVEHLRLHVDVATVEDLNLVFLQDKTRHVQQQNVYRVVFESRVTDPEEVDWRIESMHIMEQKGMERFQKAPENVTKDEKSE